MTAFKAAIVFESTDRTVPKEVIKEVENIWMINELNNDVSYFSIHLHDNYIDEFKKEYPYLYEYLMNNSPNNNLEILIHYSW